MHISTTHRSVNHYGSRPFKRCHSFSPQLRRQNRVISAKHSCSLRPSLPQERKSLDATQEHATQSQLGLLILGTIAPSIVSLPANAGVLDGIQKDTVISVAFTVAVIALGAVTLGVRLSSALVATVGILPCLDEAFNCLCNNSSAASPAMAYKCCPAFISYYNNE